MVKNQELSLTSFNNKVILFLLICFIPSVLSHSYGKETASDNKSPLASIEARKLYKSDMNCNSDVRKFDPQIHKAKYRFGIQSSDGRESTYQQYNMTFAKYLTMTAGKRFDPPIEFEMIPTTFYGMFDAVYQEDIDFFFGDPGTYTCIGVEFGAQPIATVISAQTVRGYKYDLDVYGGVIFTREDNEEISGIHDLKDKIIGAGDITMLMGAQLQFYQMKIAGLSAIMDPKQVVFTGSERDVVAGVLNRAFDVGFVRTNEIEHTKDSEGNYIDPEIFKIISPQFHALDDGDLFPFLHSTDIYPEWPVAALRHVPMDVSEEIQQALMTLNAHAAVGEYLDECRRLDPTEASCHNFTTTKCDTTLQIADVAQKASIHGKLHGFRTARSYFEVTEIQELEGIMKRDEHGHRRCPRAGSFYESIECPEGHYKLRKSDFDESCKLAGLSCEEGNNCFCKPCVQAFEVDIFQYHDDDEDLLHHEGCKKMSICGSVEQTKTIAMIAVDNMERENIQVTALLHVGKETIELEVRKNPLFSPWAYEFLWSPKEVEVGILEVSVDDEQVSESPVRIQVVQRQCESDYPGANKIASLDGECVCGRQSADIGGKCIESTKIAVICSISAFLVVAAITYCFVRYRNRQNDKNWQININDLHFDDPVEVIGEGSFGAVFQAEYLGAKIAIKRGTRQVHQNHQHHNYRSPPPSSTGASPGFETHMGLSTLSVDAEAIEDTCDLENPYNTSISNGNSKSISSSSRNKNNNKKDDPRQSGTILFSLKGSKDWSFGFLAENFGDKVGHWRFFPHKHQGNNQAEVLENILGDDSSTTSASSSTSNSYSRSTPRILSIPCWCCKTDSKKKIYGKFTEEIRVLSKLHHPCLTTVIGAVVEMDHPMLVLEYMEFGSLYYLLNCAALLDFF